MEAKFEKKTFLFKTPSGTSRGVLTEKYAWLITIKENNRIGVGECSIIPGLSPEFLDFNQYESEIENVCSNIDYYIRNQQELLVFPSILFGLETALLNLNQNRALIYFDNDFSRGNLKIPINGLVWMGDESFMLKQIKTKIEEGFKCIKIKVGAIDFEQECKILASIRSVYPEDEIEIRLDANGAFSMKEVLHKLTVLSEFKIHSIEQPIKAGSWGDMEYVVENSPIPIALDEELIGVNTIAEKIKLLYKIKPDYIILKPSLHGGLAGTKEWIESAENLNIKWWITSALESNVGLTAIAQFVSQFKTEIPQGLGTGSLYTNNIESSLKVENGYIFTV
jgi:o-succinylbenzoate synthase